MIQRYHLKSRLWILTELITIIVIFIMLHLQSGSTLSLLKSKSIELFLHSNFLVLCILTLL